jgi:hypothetical protein
VGSRDGAPAGRGLQGLGPASVVAADPAPDADDRGAQQGGYLAGMTRVEGHQPDHQALVHKLASADAAETHSVNGGRVNQGLILAGGLIGRSTNRTQAA